MSGKILIRAEKVNKIYHPRRPDAFQALHDVTLTCEEGSVVVLKGPSGSGKTSLLSLIGAMARPTSGRVLVGECEVSRLPERFLTEVRRRTFGFIFQQFHLVRNLTVLENVLLPLYPTSIPVGEMHRRGQALLERFDLQNKARRRIDQLSGGEQQRVAIARALINDPAVLIADEPTAHLDSRLAEEFLAILDSLNRQGRTIIIATHDPAVHQHPIARQIVSLHDGRVVQVDRR